MKFFTCWVFIFACVGVLVFASCKNGGSSATTKKRLVGKWKIVKITTEANYNDAAGGADENNIVIALNADGTGSSASTSGGSAFKWALADNDTYLDITDSASSQVISLLLTKTSASSFTVKDTSTHPAQWEVFKKQNDQ